MKHWLKLSALILSVTVVVGCQQAEQLTHARASTPAAPSTPYGKHDFYLTGYKHGAGPHGMDLFTFTHQGRTVTATCEQDGGDGSCSGLISKVGQHLVGADDIRDYSAKTESVSATTNGKLEIFSAPGKPAPEICNGCLKMGDPAFSLWVQSVEVSRK
jgi:hypothetical protein